MSAHLDAEDRARVALGDLAGADERLSRFDPDFEPARLADVVERAASALGEWARALRDLDAGTR